MGTLKVAVCKTPLLPKAPPHLHRKPRRRVNTKHPLCTSRASWGCPGELLGKSSLALEVGGFISQTSPAPFLAQGAMSWQVSAGHTRCLHSVLLSPGVLHGLGGWAKTVHHAGCILAGLWHILAVLPVRTVSIKEQFYGFWKSPPQSPTPRTWHKAPCCSPSTSPIPMDQEVILNHRVIMAGKDQ